MVEFCLSSPVFSQKTQEPNVPKISGRGIQNEDFWLKCLDLFIINRKELIKFIIPIMRRGHLQCTFLGVSLSKCLLLSLTKGLATLLPWLSECPSGPYVINCSYHATLGFTASLDAIILLLQLSSADVCGCFKLLSQSVYLHEVI